MTPVRTTHTWRRVALLGLPLALIVPLVVYGWRADSLDRHAVAAPVRRAPTAMPAAIARPVWHPVAGDTLASVSGFTLAGDTLVVLDPRGTRVVLLRRIGLSWHTVGAFGRPGGGPGEFRQPAAIALADDGLAVIETGGRVQRFDRGGRYQRTEHAPPPCPMFAPVIAYGANGSPLVAGNCAGPGAARDTVFTVLFRGQVGGDGTYAELARLPRMAMDLSWGSTFATLQPLSDHIDAVYFGTGLDDCILRLPGGRGAAERVCGLAHERLTAPAPPSLVAKQQAAARRGDRGLARALRWPDVLPPYLGVLPAGSGLLLARPYSADSMVLHPARQPFAPERAVLVAPLASFVTCTRRACLWYDEETNRIALHMASDARDGARSAVPAASTPAAAVAATPP